RARRASAGTSGRRTRRRSGPTPRARRDWRAAGSGPPKATRSFRPRGSGVMSSTAHPPAPNVPPVVAHGPQPAGGAPPPFGAPNPPGLTAHGPPHLDPHAERRIDVGVAGGVEAEVGLVEAPAWRHVRPRDRCRLAQAGELAAPEHARHEREPRPPVLAARRVE